MVLLLEGFDLEESTLALTNSITGGDSSIPPFYGILILLKGGNCA